MKIDEKFIELLGTLFFKLDTNGGFLDLSDACQNIFGYTKEEMIGKNFGNYISEKNQAEYKLFLKDTVENSKIQYRLELEIVARSGEKKILGFNLYLIKDEQNNMVYLFGFGTDITERKKAQEMAKELTEEWQKTFDSISDMIFIQGNDHTILRINKAFTTVLKMVPEDIVGKKCFELLHKLNAPWPDCPFERTKKDKAAHTQEVYDKNIGLPLLITVSPIFNDEGELIASVHIAKDITFIKDKEKELKRKLHDLEIFSKAAVGRELKLIELKKKIKELETKLEDKGR
ncbi:MAG: PAS domain-containing protein [bacterium]|nr:PAS domain-containing protein [bacterium]